ncbi:hypothetical protein T12_15164 [Trichinella patagoniensis]|uniref:Uncharacterized protein n=1 Tax=Trichinella patagoniensis TaxID=990121 RepID=A0A0V0YYX8_9BILA|nr:hypothetical protein T12_11279 [Trichinella patagoniensis]KRY05357.1 hypothetical protein T12_15164 [Trichinella patagoniensis]
MKIHMRIQERLDKRVCSSGFHCPTAPSVPVVVASQGIYSLFALIA